MENARPADFDAIDVVASDLDADGQPELVLSTGLGNALRVIAPRCLAP
jgi:hypothetical protein